MIGLHNSELVLTDKELDSLFAKLDTNKSGAISYTEYLAGAADLAILENEKTLEDAFNFFDRDGSKAISKAEVQSSMNKGWLSEKQLSSLFHEADSNNDEKVSSSLSPANDR
ncbi:MAG: EF-hand domain-containing protein [Candidatus Pacebacteria bacterium]|nr:EF-hand domain-containing protein [Candidatus Paceibacterota bacterium]